MAAPISTTYTPEQRAEGIAFVLDQVTAGASVAQAIAAGRKAGKCVPSKAVFWVWHRESEELQDRLARARLAGVEAQIEDAIDILDGTDLERDEDGKLRNPDDAYLMDTQRAKARAHARFQRAMMIAPRKYGPKIDVTSDGQKLHDPQAGTAAAVIDVLSSVAKRVGDSGALPSPSSTLDDLLS